MKRIASKHRVEKAFWPGTKVKKLNSKARTPLGEKKSNVIYSTSCKCKNDIHIGEAYRMFETREKEEEAKICLTKKELKEG